MAMLNIVLVEPRIHANAGNIARTCAVTDARLHLVRPFGFELDDKHLKRAGLDYWNLLDVRRYINFADFLEKNPTLVSGEPDAPKLWMATTKAHQVYSDVKIGPDDYIMFGKESAGIPEEILVEYEKSCIRIPMGQDIRSLNLSNSVAIVLYEALRQNNFAGLQESGELHRLHWKA